MDAQQKELIELAVMTVFYLFLVGFSRLGPKETVEQKKLKREDSLKAYKTFFVLIAIPASIMGAIGYGVYFLFTTPLMISLPTTAGGWLVLFLILDMGRRRKPY